ncbi:MAG: hypothetical protein Ct9H300mP12_14920 [Acidimicrobiales bacterium]|nr:MAG: hypothetical protein Ct9H300mP12_14920 [Acidimicrobiales bacterium]
MAASVISTRAYAPGAQTLTGRQVDQFVLAGPAGHLVRLSFGPGPSITTSSMRPIRARWVMVPDRFKNPLKSLEPVHADVVVHEVTLHGRRFGTPARREHEAVGRVVAGLSHHF